MTDAEKNLLECMANAQRVSAALNAAGLLSAYEPENTNKNYAAISRALRTAYNEAEDLRTRMLAAFPGIVT